jgi:hypothetical protein
VPEPFGAGPPATRQAIEHLGCIQIDTINVIERCDHHILQTRIPAYRRADLDQAQRIDKSMFEYWTHALSSVPTCDYPYFIGRMRQLRTAPQTWFGTVTPKDRRWGLWLLRDGGPRTIRDIDDDVLVEKHHPWAIREPVIRTG